MTDDHPPIDDDSTGAQPVDDDLVSAVLDGEATSGERALVEGSPEGRRRLEELRAAAAAVAAAVPPLEGATADALIARALDAAPTPVTVESSPTAPSVAADELVARRRRRDTGRLWRRIGTAAAAAVVVVVAGIAALARSGDRSSSDSASSSAADATRDPTSEQSTGGAAGPVQSYVPASGETPPQLGTLPDAAAVLDRYVVLLTVQPSIDHQFDESRSSSSNGATPPSTSPEVAARLLESCPVPPVPPSPGESWTVTATGLLPGGPVLVMSDGLAPPANRVLVVDASTCIVLAERTI
jgi:hypothetical protein